MKILYVEDDFIDKKNMEYVCKSSQIDLEIIDSFKEVNKLISNKQFNYLIVDQYVHGEHVTEYLNKWKKLPLAILTNTSEVKSYKGKVITKPITKEKLTSLLTQKKNTTSVDVSFFDSMPVETKNELISLLKTEFKNFQIKSKAAIQQQDLEELIHLTHKISSKFSILKDKETFLLCRETEKELTNGKANYNAVMQIADTCSIVLKKLNDYENKSTYN